MLSMSQRWRNTLRSSALQPPIIVVGLDPAIPAPDPAPNKTLMRYRGAGMKRRDLLSAFAAGAFAQSPLTALAQQPRRIGFLRLAPIDAAQIADFRAGLEETGYAEGRNLVIEYRYADGDYARL